MAAEGDQERARRLLRSCLNTPQRLEYEASGRFRAKGGATGAEFIITPEGVVRNKTKFPGPNSDLYHTYTYCIYPLETIYVDELAHHMQRPGEGRIAFGNHHAPIGFPVEDIMLALLLMIQYDEQLFRNTAL